MKVPAADLYWQAEHVAFEMVAISHLESARPTFFLPELENV